MWAGASSSNVVNAAAALIVAALVIAALILGRDFLLPLALATLLSFALQPAVRWLEDYKLPRPAAVALVVLSLIATAVAAGAFLAKEVTGFAEELPRYQENLRTKIKDATGTLGSVGIWRTATEVLRNVGGELTERPKGGEPVKVEVQNESVKPVHGVCKISAAFDLTLDVGSTCAAVHDFHPLAISRSARPNRPGDGARGDWSLRAGAQ